MRQQQHQGNKTIWNRLCKLIYENVAETLIILITLLVIVIRFLAGSPPTEPPDYL